ncbi:MAG: type II toxin-antitoxin system RelE family toxin [Bacteroidota bacterium]
MIVEIKVNKKFLKELAALPVKTRQKAEKLTFEEIPSCKNINDIPNIQKLSGYKNYYRIRLGQYRIGLRYEENTLIFERIMHRGKIFTNISHKKSTVFSETSTKTF